MPAPHHSVFTGRMTFLPPNQQRLALRAVIHRHRIDNYLVTQHPVTTAEDRVSTDHFQKLQSQDGGLPELLLA